MIKFGAGYQKTSSNANVDSKVRQVLKTYPEDFECVGRGELVHSYQAIRVWM